MRYLTDASGFVEALQVGIATGAMPPTYLRPRLRPETRLALESVTSQPCGDMTLVLAEHTASWVLLDAREADAVHSLTNIRCDEFERATSARLGSSAPDYLTRLYQRGLLRLDGAPGLDPNLLSDGALFEDTYLVEILVTQKCNLGCLYCLAEAGPDMQHLPPHLARAAIDAAFKLPKSRPLTIQLSGGEPLLNFTLFKSLVHYIETKRDETGRDMRIATQSNGTLIDDEIAAFVRDHHIMIGISCDGPSMLNDVSRPTLRGRPSLDRTLRGILALRRNGVSFGLITVLSRANVDHPRDLVDFFCEQGIAGVKINPVNIIGDAQARWSATGISTDEYFMFMEEFIDYVIDTGAELAEANLSQYLQRLTRRVHNYRCMRSNCGAGKSFFLIDSRGEIYPCAHSAGIPSWNLGSIAHADGDLSALGAENAVLVDFPRRLVDQIDTTKQCPWRHFCEGGCAVNAYQHSITILAPDTLCAFYERFYPRLLERLAREPDRFQRLLDVMLGDGAATVVDV